MGAIFFKWIKYLQSKNITKFLGLYSNHSILIPKIEKPIKPSLINPYPEDVTLHGRVGAFKNFENIFFSHYREFKITDHNVIHVGKNKTLFADCNFYYKGFIYHTTHNMSLTNENSEDKIIYHHSVLKRMEDY